MECIYKSSCKKKDCDIWQDITNNFCMRYFKIDKILDNAMLSPKQRKDIKLVLDSDKSDYNSYATLNKFKESILNNIEDNVNLYIYSEITGNGKTSWAIKLLTEYVKKNWINIQINSRPVLFINVPQYLLELKLNIRSQSEYVQIVQDNFLKADLIVWDDIGTKTASDFELEYLLSMIDNRQRLEQKIDIYTSNIIPTELQKYVGDRLASRILNTSQLIEFKGQDKRGLNI